MDTDSNKVTWVVVIVAAVAIMGGLFVKFVPNSTSQIQVYAQTVIGNVRHSSDTANSGSSSDTANSGSSNDSSGSSDTVDSDDNSGFTYSDPDTKNNTISVIGYKGNATNLIIPKYRKIGLVEYKVTAIGNNAFKNNKSITQVTIPDSVQTIGTSAFEYNSNLKSLTLGSGVTTIGYAAFAYDALTNVDFPASLTSIGGCGFMYDPLTSISVKSPANFSSDTFGYTKLTNVTLPKGSTYDTRMTWHPTFYTKTTSYPATGVTLYSGTNVTVK